MQYRHDGSWQARHSGSSGPGLACLADLAHELLLGLSVGDLVYTLLPIVYCGLREFFGLERHEL